MDDAPLAAESDSPQAAAEAWPTLEYGRPGHSALGRLIRGVGLLLLVVGGIGFFVECLGLIGWLIASGGFDVNSLASFPLIAGAADAGSYLLLAVGGLLCRRHHPAAATLVCVGAAASLLSGLLIPPAFYYFIVLRSGGIGGNNLGELAGLAYQVLRGLPTTLLPLLLLWLFSRRLIRDAIGVK